MPIKSRALPVADCGYTGPPMLLPGGTSQPLGPTTTQDSGADATAEQVQAVPGVVVIFANGKPRCRIFRWEGVPLELGRLELAEDDELDSMISRKHVRLALDGAAWQIADLGSRNGTFLSGNPISGQTKAASGSLIRVGGALLMLAPDTVKYQQYGLGARDGTVGGPSLRSALETVALARAAGMLRSLLVSGESGTGKEIAARVFHASGPDSKAPFVAVNCATIPKDLAERLLFGSRRGAFTNATDAPGYVQTADGGTLFLDEIAELAPEVQTKLLRMLETREVLRLGATSPERVELRVCVATWRDLREEVLAGRFREDLYFRVGQPEIRLPPLRQRLEEIPWHIRHVLEECGVAAQLEVSAAFVEACALRHWPGNVRELRAEIKRAAAIACAQDSSPLKAKDLSPTAGIPIDAAGKGQGSTSFPEDEIATALAAENGNVLAAARRLGIHRNKIRRWLERHGADAQSFKRMRT